MAAICAAPIKGTHLRLVKLDVCGIPVTGTGALTFVTKGFVQVQMEPDYEEGEEFFERNADGDACVNQKDKPTLKRFTLTVDLCEVDPTAVAHVLDARLLTTGAATTGTGFAMVEGGNDAKFSLEVWQRVAGSGACDATGAQNFIYNAWPHVGNAMIGTYTIENGRSTLQFEAETFGANTNWGDGPGAATWLPSGATVTALDHWLWNISTTALPTEACGPTTLT